MAEPWRPPDLAATPPGRTPAPCLEARNVAGSPGLIWSSKAPSVGERVPSPWKSRPSADLQEFSGKRSLSSGRLQGPYQCQPEPRETCADCQDTDHTLPEGQVQGLGQGVASGHVDERPGDG